MTPLFESKETDRWARPPAGVEFFHSAQAYVEAAPDRRRIRAFGSDLDGWDVAHFRLENPYGPAGSHSTWRIGVMGREVYAVLRRWPLEQTYTFEGPVWLIDTVPDLIGPTVDDRPIRTLTDQIEQHVKDPDSLLLAVEWIRTAFAMIDAINPFDVIRSAQQIIDKG